MRKPLLILLALLACPGIAYSESLNLEISSGLNLEMIKCPTGKFTYGCAANEIGYMANNDLPLIEATIDKDFYISKFETTQALYKEIMGENPSKNQSNDLPVEKVTYAMAVEFCDRLNEITSDTRPAGFEFKLPTEKQWEYACRAGTNTSLNNGKNLQNAKSECSSLNDVAWYKYNSGTKTHPVGQKTANNWGICDMHGNVAEWCSDIITQNNDGKKYGILRGGAYFYEPERNRAASRGCSLADSVSSAFGFRVALVQTSEQTKSTSTTETVSTPTPTPAQTNTSTANTSASGDISNAVIKTETTNVSAPAPVVTETTPAPVVNTPAPAPVVTETAPAPVVNTPAPVITETAPAPVVNTPAPAPVVTETAPAPVVNTPAPAPVVTETAPAPVVNTPAPAPVVTETAPAPVVNTPAPVVTETAPAPVVTRVTSYVGPQKAGEKISISVKNVKFPLIGCPAGSYIMGSPANEPYHTDKENQKQVTFDKGFYIGKYEITQGQYVTIMGSNPSEIIGNKLPVHNVSWSDAQKFCDRLNELTLGTRPVDTEFALPTEAQWEYACRSGYNTALNNGKNLVNLNAADQELNQLAWYDANSSEKIQTVGKKVANSWGIHDMHGNVWEWCSDKGAEITMFGKKHETRVARGGSYKTKANECRSANHKEFRETPAQIDFGFRVILREKQ